jgi:hypothetical protein
MTSPSLPESKATEPCEHDYRPVGYTASQFFPASPVPVWTESASQHRLLINECVKCGAVERGSGRPA